MATSWIDIGIRGIDLLSGQLARWKPRWKSDVEQGATQWKGILEGFRNQGQAGGGSFGQGFLGALGGVQSLFAGAIGGIVATSVLSLVGAAVSAVQSALGAFKDSVWNAAQMETRMIGASSDLSMNLGISQQAAQEIYKNTQSSIADLAAALPGVTQDYNALMEGLVPSVSQVFQGNAEGYEAAIIDITKRAGVLAAKSGADPNMAGSALNRFISGTAGFQEVMMIDIFQKNAQFQTNLRNELAKMGVGTEDWKKLTNQQRLKVTQEALRLSTPDSLIEEFEGTTESIVQQIQTALFDPIKGWLGFLRQVPDLGNRTVLNAVQGFLQAIMGLFENIGRIGDQLGINLDPMAGLIRIIDFFTNMIHMTNTLLVDLEPGTDLALGLTSGIIDLMESIAYAVDWVAVGLAVGKILGVGFLNSMKLLFWDLPIGLLKAMVGLDWMGLFKLTAKSFMLPFEMVQQGIGGVLQGIWDGVLQIFRDMGNDVMGAVQGLRDGISGIMSSLRQGALGAMTAIVPGGGILSGIGGMVDTIFNLNKQEPTPATVPVQAGLNSVAPLAQPNVNSNSVSFAPRLNVNTAASDPNVIAQLTMDRLAQMYRDIRGGTLA